MYDKYSPKGLEVFGFPCNQFGNQESKCESDIKKYVIEEFGVKFPMFSKIDVNGPNAHDIYTYLKINSLDFNRGNKENPRDIPWAFAKFLVDPEGKVHGYFGPKTQPNKMLDSVEGLLKISRF